MGTFAVGDVVLIPFPYADFSKVKKRPALIVGEAESDNLILCQITSKAGTSKKAASLSDSDFAKGSLHLDSYVRPDKLFTIEQSIIDKAVGSVQTSKLETIKAQIRQIFS